MKNSDLVKREEEINCQSYKLLKKIKIRISLILIIMFLTCIVWTITFFTLFYIKMESMVYFSKEFIGTP
jgi:hypothetical protein